MLFYLPNFCSILYFLLVIKLNDENKDYVDKIVFTRMHNKNSNTGTASVMTQLLDIWRI
jgi:hypothetical protein